MNASSLSFPAQLEFFPDEPQPPLVAERGRRVKFILTPLSFAHCGAALPPDDLAAHARQCFTCQRVNKEDSLNIPQPISDK